RGAVGRGGEAGVATAALRPAGHHETLASLGEVAQALAAVAVGDGGAEGHAEHGVLPAPPVLVGALPMRAALRGVVPLVVEVEERGHGRISLEDHVAAVAPVAAVRAASGHELLTPEADAARAAVASLDEHVDLVDEHGVVAPARRGRAGSGRLLL